MATTPLIPRAALFGNPTKTSPQLSPDGKRFAYLAPVDGVLNIWVGVPGADDAKPATRDKDRGIRSFSWAYDNTHLLYNQDQGGNEDWHVHTTNVVTGETVDVTPFENVSAQLSAMSKRFPDKVHIGINATNPQLHDIYELTLSTGELVQIAENPGFLGMFADEDLQVRGAMSATPEGGRVVLVRDDVEGEWGPIVTADHEDALTTGPMGFSGDGKRLLARSSVGGNTARLVWIDLADGSETLIAQHDTYDIGGALCELDTNEPLAYVVNGVKPTWHTLDESVAGDLAFLGHKFDGTFSIVSRTMDDRTWLVAGSSDTNVTSFWTYDRDAGSATFLFRTRDDLDPYTLSPMTPFKLTSRDGLTIHGYLTVPAGVEATNLPTVLNVHGGPWSRDSWGLNPEIQWLANRGYAVVQVNFRGSTGFGKNFLNAGDREWGARMHDDLLDALDHLAAQGTIDRSNVCIYGGSYGGYAALFGATFTPEEFSCAVDIVGISNINSLIRSVPEYWKPMISQFHNRVGNPDTEEDFLWSRSPLSKVDNISIPLLIAQGANDPRVKQAESEQIVDAMKERGVPHEYLLFADEGHGFAKPENKMRFHARAEAFLAKTLGGRAEAPSAEELMEPASEILA